jgi:hypothetical protein
LGPNFDGMVRGWSPSKIVSGSLDLQPTWSLLLEIKKGDEIQNIFISEITGPIGTKLCLVLWWPPFKIGSVNPDIQPTWPLLLKTEKVDAILIVFLLNYWANHGFKLCYNNPLVIPFQNFVWRSRPRTKIGGRCYYLLTIPSAH